MLSKLPQIEFIGRDRGGNSLKYEVFFSATAIRLMTHTILVIIQWHDQSNTQFTVHENMNSIIMHITDLIDEKYLWNFRGATDTYSDNPQYPFYLCGLWFFAVGHIWRSYVYKFWWGTVYARLWIFRKQNCISLIPMTLLCVFVFLWSVWLHWNDHGY